MAARRGGDRQDGPTSDNINRLPVTVIIIKTTRQEDFIPLIRYKIS